MPSASADDLYLHIPLSSLVAAAQRWVWATSPANREKDLVGSEIWAFDRETGVRQVTDDGHGPVLSKDGLCIAFLRWVDGSAQIFIHDDIDGSVRQVTHGVSGIESIEQWDHAQDCFLVRIRRAQEGADDDPISIRHLPYKQDGKGILRGSAHLHCIDASSGKTQRLVAGNSDVLEARWSADGRILAYIKCRDGHQRHLMDLWVQHGDEDARQVTADLASLSGLSWSPDGSKIAFAASAIEGDWLATYIYWISRPARCNR